MPRVSDERLREQAIKDVAIDAGSSPSYVRLCLSDIKRHFDDSLIFQYAVAQREQLLALREAVCGQDGALAQLEAAEIALVNCVPITPYKGDGPLVSLRAAKAKLEELR